jgi:DNA-binding Xre family transcriptional regulator
MTNSNKIICTYISKEWIGEYSHRSFAQEHNIDESTVKKIIDLSEGKIDNYKIPVITLLKICEAKKITLSDFFEKMGM